MIALVVPLLLAASGENRLWFVDLELHGACTEVRLECGSDGETRLFGPFSSGEDRRLRVPVPVRSPLGAGGLKDLPLPTCVLEPNSSAASVRVLGWSSNQPAVELERLAAGLLARPRPPGSSEPPRPRSTELFLVLLAGGLLLRYRRRTLLFAGLALGCGLVAFELARSRLGQGQGERLLEWEAGQTLALLVDVADDELALPRTWLEVAPEGRSLFFRTNASSEGAVSARATRLFALEGTPPPPFVEGRNAGEPLAAVWTRAESGVWHAHGPWDSGAVLGPGSMGGEDPPGWLGGALAPGRSLLLARARSGIWLRCVGFKAQ